MIEKIEYGTKDLGMILDPEENAEGLLSGNIREPWMQLDAYDLDAEGLAALVDDAFHRRGFHRLSFHYNRPRGHVVKIKTDTIRIHPVPLPPSDHVPHIVIELCLYGAQITWAVGGVTHHFTLPSVHSSHWR